MIAVAMSIYDGRWVFRQVERCRMGSRAGLSPWSDVLIATLKDNPSCPIPPSSNGNRGPSVANFCLRVETMEGESSVTSAKDNVAFFDIWV